MRIIPLTEDSKNNILDDLLKRSPNNYDQYRSEERRVGKECL